MLRNIGDIFASISMCLALAYVPLSIIGAVIQTVPLMITVVAALFLGERVGIRRISAIIIGFSGVLFILQPGNSDFDHMVFLALMAAIGMTVRDIGTKLISTEVSTLLLSLYAAVLFIFSGSVLLMITGGARLPDAGMFGLFAAMIVLGSLGYIFVTNAIRLGEMSVVSPFRYSRLLFLSCGRDSDPWRTGECHDALWVRAYDRRRTIYLATRNGSEAVIGIHCECTIPQLIRKRRDNAGSRTG